MTSRKPIVAIVENDISIIKALRRLLHALGYKSEVFTSAEMFLQRDGDEQLSCLLLDVNLDGLSGIDLQRILVTKKTAPPIIFMSGQGTDETVRKAVEMGCIAFLHKPFESDALSAAIRKAMLANEAKAQ